MNLELLCRRMLEALMNGGYQGLLLTAVVFVVLWVMRRSSAATRHNICLVTLLLVALLPAAHFARSTSMFTWFASSVTADDHFDGVMTAMEVPLEDGNRGYQFFGGANDQKPNIELQGTPKLFSIEQGGERVESRSESEENRKTAAIQPDASGEATSVQAFEGAKLETGSAIASVSQGSAPALPQWSIAIPFSSRQCMAIVVGIAAIGLIRFGGLTRQLWVLRGLKRKGKTASSELQECFDTLGTEMKLQRSAQLLVAQSEGRFSPCAVGFWRPAVIVPEGMLEGRTENAEAILRHELAHIDRRDDWATLFQEVIHALLFFHPAIWMLSRRLSMEREIACDDHVLAARPNRRSYALLLTEFAGQAGASRFTAAPAAWGRKKQLKRRIDMILNKNRNSSPRSSRGSVGIMGATAALATVLGIGFAPQIAVAQPAAEPATGDEEVTADAVVPAHPDPVVAPVPVSPRRARVAVAAAVPVTPGVVPYIAAEPQPPAEPGAAAARRKARTAATAGDGGSVEARLDRLERMIEELVARDKGVYGKGGGFPQWPGYKHDPKEIGRMQKEMERANKEVERAAKDAAKSFADAQKNWNFEGFQNFQYGDFKNPKAHRKALEAQRKALEKQLQVIEQRIDALQDDEEAEHEEANKIKEKIKEKQSKSDEKEQTDSATGEKARE